MDKKNNKNHIEFLSVRDGKHYIQTFDKITNELISEREAVPKRNSRLYFGKKEFFTMHKRICKMLKGKKEYNGLTFRLLFELLERIELNNRIGTFRQEELAKALETHQPKIHASLKTLESDDIIKKVKHDYYFTPKFVRYISDSSMPLLDTENLNSESEGE